MPRAINYKRIENMLQAFATRADVPLASEGIAEITYAMQELSRILNLTVEPPLGMYDSATGRHLIARIPKQTQQPAIIQQAEYGDSVSEDAQTFQIVQQINTINQQIVNWFPEEQYEEYFQVPCCLKYENIQVKALSGGTTSDFALGSTTDYLQLTTAGSNVTFDGMTGGIEGRIIEVTNYDGTGFVKIPVPASSLSGAINQFQPGPDQYAVTGMVLAPNETVPYKYSAKQGNLWWGLLKKQGPIKVTFFSTGSGNFTPQQNTVYIWVRIWGGGGQGGGVAATNAGATTAGAGGGGGSGAYCEKFASVTSVGQVMAYSVGAAGSSGGAGADGQNGGDTTFTAGSFNLTAPGGKGGKHGLAVTGKNGIGGAGGAGGLVGTNGDANGIGQSGIYGFVLWDGAVIITTSGLGGFNQFGAGGAGAVATNAAAVAGPAGNSGGVLIMEFA